VVAGLALRPHRDWTYDLIAANRIQWFGARDVCLIASQEERARFLM
jgi:predicted DCC family thiol-disulfide oxidoreductase YuxK